MSVKIFWNAESTLVESRAEVSMNERPFSAVKLKVIPWLLPQPTSMGWIRKRDVPQKALASSVETALRCLRSHLLPTSVITMFESA